jgi:hypothetical protein
MTNRARYLGLPLTMSTPDNKQSLRKQLKQKLRSTFSTKSRNLDVPDAGPTGDSASTTPHSVSPAHNNSRVDLVQETDIVNPPSTVQGLTGIGELISYTWCFDQALKSPRRSWIRYGRSCTYKLPTSRQYPRKFYVGNINWRRYVLDPCISHKPYDRSQVVVSSIAPPINASFLAAQTRENSPSDGPRVMGSGD